ncbi:Hypothetical_protein [Hexamita inflata]|uniref:Hypothetical_protein n=1 Tax=Hexamita inflata TaxID=28002 RepID=A0AA86U745_9EUKA|nr:Hypothetical protein HINF_LOCUS31289 [Hexamita inflata]
MTVNNNKNQQQYFQIESYLENMYIEIYRIDPEFQVCFSPQFIKQSSECILTVNQTGSYKITPQMKNILIKSEIEGQIEFQLKIKQPDNNDDTNQIFWIILAFSVVCTIAIVVISVLCCRKCKNRVQNIIQSDQLIVTSTIQHQQ